MAGCPVLTVTIMYSRIAVLLSVTGVLAAGTASTLGQPDARGQIASSTSSASSITAASTPNSAPDAAASTVPDGTVVVGQPVPNSATQQSFVLGDAATVIVDTANGQLAIVVIAPHPGWNLTRAELRDVEAVEIRLESSNGDVRFEADLINGTVVASMRDDDDGTSTTIGTGSTISSGSTGSTISSGSTGSTVDDNGDDNGDDDQTSSTIGTGTTVGTGSTGTTIDDHGGSGNSGSGGSDDDNSGGANDNSGRG